MAILTYSVPEKEASDLDCQRSLVEASRDPHLFSGSEHLSVHAPHHVLQNLSHEVQTHCCVGRQERPWDLEELPWERRAVDQDSYVNHWIWDIRQCSVVGDRYTEPTGACR